MRRRRPRERVAAARASGNGQGRDVERGWSPHSPRAANGAAGRFSAGVGIRVVEIVAYIAAIRTPAAANGAIRANLAAWGKLVGEGGVVVYFPAIGTGWGGMATGAAAGGGGTGGDVGGECCGGVGDDVGGRIRATRECVGGECDRGAGSPVEAWGWGGE